MRQRQTLWQAIQVSSQHRLMRHNPRFRGYGQQDVPASNSGARPFDQAQVLEWLEQSRVIPSVRTSQSLPAACASPSKLAFLLFGTPLIVGDLVAQLRDAGKLPIANMDLLAGFARDSAAIEFLARAGVAGIISTHQDALRLARSHGLLSFQRTFALDSVAVANSVRSLEHFLPDVIELLPAIAAPLILPAIQKVSPKLPVIGCGLIRSLCQIDELVRQGIISISVSEPALWIV